MIMFAHNIFVQQSFRMKVRQIGLLAFIMCGVENSQFWDCFKSDLDQLWKLGEASWINFFFSQQTRLNRFGRTILEWKFEKLFDMRCYLLAYSSLLLVYSALVCGPLTMWFLFVVNVGVLKFAQSNFASFTFAQCLLGTLGRLDFTVLWR